MGCPACRAVCCAAGYNLRWLLRAMLRMGLKALVLRPLLLAWWAALSLTSLACWLPGRRDTLVTA